MNNEIYDKYKLAGRIAAEARNYGIALLKPGASFLDIANKVESKILERGGGLAFPVNISINEIAAHYSPKHDDTITLTKGDVVKLDIGAHVDGYIADTALTLEIENNHYNEMIKASSDALDAAINLLKPGINLYEIGKAVQDTIGSYGYKPIDNLTGHSMQRYLLHAGMSIPNVLDKIYNSKPKVGDVFAIEPFATNGAGHVVSGAGSNIYLCLESFKQRLIRDKEAKIIFEKIKNEFKTLPFAQRWLKKQFSYNEISLRKLSFIGLIKHYPQLIDAKKGIVTQKEHTVIVTEDGCEVIT
jgi:methionyl aminopeptidase